MNENVVPEPDGKSLRFPNDLVYSLWVPPKPKPEGRKSKGNTDRSNYTRLSLTSTVPAFINYSSGATLESLIANIKDGHDLDSTKTVPLTCLETGVTKIVNFSTYKTTLADRYLNTNSWVRLGGRKGQIKNIKSTFDLEIRHSNLVVENVPETEIEPQPVYYPGQYVYLNGYVGYIKSTRRKLLLRYKKGYECLIYEKDFDDLVAEEDSFPYPDFRMIRPGDTISPSSRDIVQAHWIKKPGWIDWFYLRWLNWGFHESTSAKVIENTLESVMVDWYISPTRNAGILAPPRTITGDDLETLLKLEMYGLWYGVTGSYKIKDADVILTTQEWEARLGQELQYSVVIRHIYSGLITDKVLDLMNTEKSRFKSGDSVSGKVIARRAIARVSWEDGIKSEVPVKELTPYYPVIDKEFPFSIGDVVLKNIYGSSLKLLYGIVQNRQPGLCLVKWFGTESAEVLPVFVRNWENTEAVESLHSCVEYKFPIGLIVFTVAKNEPGVVVGNNLSGQVYVKMWAKVCKFFAYELYKFERIAHLVGYGRDVMWAKLSDKYFLNQKHIGFSMANIFNVTLPSSVLHSIPEIKYFELLETAPNNHNFNLLGDSDASGRMELEMEAFKEIWKKEISLLESSKLPGTWIKVFEDKLYLISVMMTGLPGSLYEGALFQFDIYLPPTYPQVLPVISFVSYEQRFGLIRTVVDRYLFKKFHLDLIDDDGTLNLESILGGRDDLGLWLVLAHVQQELLGFKQMNEGMNGGTLSAIKRMAFSSYTGEIQDGIQNQVVLNDILTSMVRWLITPPELWQNEVWKYWKLELPLFIARIKRLLRLCEGYYDQNNSENEEKYDLLASSLTPADPVLVSEIETHLQDLVSVYCKMY